PRPERLLRRDRPARARPAQRHRHGDVGDAADHADGLGHEAHGEGDSRGRGGGPPRDRGTPPRSQLSRRSRRGHSRAEEVRIRRRISSTVSFTDPSARAADAALGRGEAVERVDSHAVFGQVMGLVAVTVAFTAAGAYIGRDLTGGIGIAFFIGAIVCVIGLNVAAKRSEPLAIVLLFSLGLLLGLAVAPVLNYYAQSDPG